MSKFRVLAAFIIVAVGVGTAFYLGIFNRNGAASAQDSQAKQQFLTERGGGEVTKMGGRAGEQMVHGTVEQVDGEQIAVKDTFDNSTITLQLSETTKIYKHTALQTSDINSGDTVVVDARLDGEQRIATMVQVGDVAAPKHSQASEGVRVFRTDGQAGGAPGVTVIPHDTGDSPNAQALPPGQGQLASMSFETVHGVVESLENDTLVVKQTDGRTVTIKLDEKTTVQRRDKATAADIEVGKHIMAVGQEEDGVVIARTVEITVGPMVHIEMNSTP